MEKTEQTKSQIVSYLTKTSQHIFIKPHAKFIWSQQNSHYEYDYDNFTYFKVIKKDDDFYYLDKTSSDYKISKIDIDYYIKYWNKNAKCVLSNQLFLDKKMKSVKNTKQIECEIDEILNLSDKKL